MVVAPNGVLYVNTWSGGYYANSPPPSGGFLIALQDASGHGNANVIRRFGATPARGGHGGTGIALYDGYLYAELNDRIVRYPMSPTSIVPAEPAQTVVSGLPLTGDHPMHPFAIDADGWIYVDSASPSNSCQRQNRMQESPGINPCPELATRGGIWRYSARKLHQRFSPAARYATGIRNADGITIDSTGHNVYSTQQGRDQLGQNWPKFFTPEQGAYLPSEEVMHVVRGGDFGWPYCYYDGVRQKLMLAPEYGGNGKKVGRCARMLDPVAAFPAHWAPNDLRSTTASNSHRPTTVEYSSRSMGHGIARRFHSKVMTSYSNLWRPARRRGIARSSPRDSPEVPRIRVPRPTALRVSRSDLMALFTYQTTYADASTGSCIGAARAQAEE